MRFTPRRVALQRLEACSPPSALKTAFKRSDASDVKSKRFATIVSNSVALRSTLKFLLRNTPVGIAVHTTDDAAKLARTTWRRNNRPLLLSKAYLFSALDYEDYVEQRWQLYLSYPFRALHLTRRL